MKFREWRLRKIKKSDGGKEEFFIRRLYCEICDCIHHELPDFVIPYKRYDAETIEKIISGNTDGLACDESTIRRILNWWSIVYPYFVGILASLNEKFKVIQEIAPTLKGIVRAVVNSNNWVFKNKLLTQDARASSKRALCVCDQPVRPCLPASGLI